LEGSPRSGSIVANDIVVDGPKTNLGEPRRSVGMVFPQFNLFPQLTAAEKRHAGTQGR
jgi:ABC-type polar amino acid transport system ATPase subunit